MPIRFLQDDRHHLGRPTRGKRMAKSAGAAELIGQLGWFLGERPSPRKTG